MAFVYQVRHEILHSRHALKVLRPELAAHEEIRARFLDEGRIQAQIRHPNLVEVTGAVAEAGIAGLVMEAVEGPSLHAWLAEHPGPVDLATIEAILLPLLSAAGAAPARGIVHRDLKPENIVLARRRDGALRPVILDFGVAKIREESDLGGAGRTATGRHMGTPHYMSPEQVRGLRELDQRTDIFALGAILYELLTGSLCFEAESAFDAMQAIVDGRWTPIRQRIPSIHPALEEVLGRALALDPEDRFADCAAFSRALTTALREEEGDATTATRPVETPQAQPPPRSQPRKGCSCGSVLIGVIALLALLMLVRDLRRHARSMELTEEATEILRHFKTDPKANQKEEALARAERLLDESVALRPEGEGRGLDALVKVWREGWHLTSMDAARVRTRWAPTWSQVEALDTPPTPAGSLARALMDFGACGTLPAQDLRCKEADNRFAGAWVELASQPGWLRMEVAWPWATHLQREADRARAANDIPGAAQRMQALNRLCEEAEPLLPAAPVNDVYLVRPCLHTAAEARDWSTWMRRARWLRARDEDRGDGLSATTVRRIYQSADLDCRDLDRASAARWGKAWVPAVSSDTQKRCYAAGLLALGCADMISDLAPRSGSPEAATWQAIVDTAPPPDRPCYIVEAGGRP